MFEKIGDKGKNQKAHGEGIIKVEKQGKGIEREGLLERRKRGGVQD